jgi:hypothetical protein
MNQKLCPFCRSSSAVNCSHLALAVEGREFVRRCVEAAGAQGVWQTLCQSNRDQLRRTGEWAPDCEDFTWLETAFCERFLKGLHWFGGLEHEWRSGPDLSKGGFCVLLWSRDPERLWWDLRDEIERQSQQGTRTTPLPQPELAHVAAAFSGVETAPAAH